MSEISAECGGKRGLFARLGVGGLCAALVALLAACGSGNETIPRSEANDLLSTLEAADAALAEGDCETVSQAALEFSIDAGSLPLGVDRQLRTDLARGAQQLLDLVDECEPATPEPEELEPEPEPAPEPEEPEPEPAPEPEEPEPDRDRGDQGDQGRGPGGDGQGGGPGGGSEGGSGDSASGGTAPPRGSSS